MKPSEHYHRLLADKHIQDDPEQLALLREFDRLYAALLRKRSWWRRRRTSARGLYLCGEVGIGKTFLLDLFYNSLPSTRKMRSHFHPFMQQIHQDLHALSDKVDPLKHIARKLAKQIDVLCFDEFFVNDIGDAMILAGLLAALFSEGVILVATSNVSPDKLYLHGLGRARFLPAIALIKQHCHVYQMQGSADYRLQTIARQGTYFYPLTRETRQQMRQTFLALSKKKVIAPSLLIILGREILTLGEEGDMIWFDFDVLCHAPRSQRDYIAIAKQYRLVFVSNVPAMAADQIDRASYFINLVDVFYDAHVQLILSAAVPVEEIYRDGRKQEEFKRTVSRLVEMRSIDYLRKK